MGWGYLLLAGGAEIFWAAAMPKTVGFTKLGPSLFTAFFIAASMYPLSLATKIIPTGTACPVRVGIGALGLAAYANIALGEDRGLLRMICFLLMLAGIVGQKLVSPAAK